MMGIRTIQRIDQVEEEGRRLGKRDLDVGLSLVVWGWLLDGSLVGQCWLYLDLVRLYLYDQSHYPYNHLRILS
jgi:hypothetical protein